MDSESLVRELRELEMFDGIAADHLRRLAEICKLVEFPPNAEIFREQAPAKNVYILLAGRVSLSTCAEHVGCRQLTVAGRGELLGWSPLVGRQWLSDTARTLSPTRAITFDGAQALALCSQDTHFGFTLMLIVAQTLADRLGSTRRQLMELSGSHLPVEPLESD